MNRTKRTLFCLAVITVAAHPTRADDRAPETALARRLFREGLSHADAGRWTEASERFDRAYAIRPSPEIGYNLATALERSGQLVRASHLLSTIAESPGARPAVRGAARARLGEVLPRVPRLTVQASAPDRQHLWLDGRPLDPARTALPMTVDPGEHLLELRLGSEVALSRRVTLAEGDNQAVIFEQPRPPAAAVLPAPRTLDLAATPPRERNVLRNPWFWGVVGTAVLASAAAVLLASRGGGGGREVRGNVETWTLPR
jgi:hypothetical protein